MSLASKFENFMRTLPSVQVIDDMALNLEQRQYKIADYYDIEKNIVLEQKSISKDQVEKVEKELDKYKNNDDYPKFFGERDLEEILEYLPNSEKIKKRIYFQITKLFEGYLSNANKQIKSTSSLFGLEKSTGVLVILNENIKILSPHIIVKRIYERSQEKVNGLYRFENIDYVLLITTTHIYKGSSFISGVIDLKDKEDQCQKTIDFLDYIMNEWSIYCEGVPVLKAEPDVLFELNLNPDSSLTEETIYTKRSLWYKKNRYMRGWPDSKIENEMEKIYCRCLLSQNKNNQQMKLKFNDFVEETNLRNMNLRFLKKY